MDKKSITGIVLIGLIFLGFTMYNTKQQEKWLAQQAEIEAEAARQDSIYRAEHPELSDTLALASEPGALLQSDSLSARMAEVAYYGEYLAAALTAPVEQITLENEVLKVDFSTLGAQVREVTLKEYTKYGPKGERNELVRMFDPEFSSFDLEFYVRNGYKSVPVKTSEFVFTNEGITSLEGAQRLTLRLAITESASLKFVYTLHNTTSPERDYLLDFDVEMEQMAPVMANQTNLLIDWTARTFQNEKGFKNENMYTTLCYRFPGDTSIEELGMSEEEKDEQESTAVEWVAFKQQFFSSVLIAYDNFSTSDMRFETQEPGSGYVKQYALEATIPYTPQTEALHFGLYYGPNKYAILKKVVDPQGEELQLERMIPLGWGIFGWVNRWFVIPVFDLLRQVNLNFGIIILILAVLVKVIIFPMTYKSYVSMAKMRVIKPEIDAINEKYPRQEDAMKRQQATMDLYKKAGINPMGGCIPMLIQMPIIIAMFRFFPASIELRGQHFLWADDLSSYDSILDLGFSIPFYGDHISLFALLMTAALFIFSWINYQQTASSQPQMPGMKFMMLYMMPLMMLFWFNDYASGLCFYYFIANLLTIAQTILIRRFVDDTKIRLIMESNAAKRKNQKKSKFQQRYEELMRQQELMQQQQQKQQRRK